MTRKPVRHLALLLALCLLAGASIAPLRGSAAQGASMCFPDVPGISNCIQGRFLQYWLDHGGLAQQGYPITGELQERSDTDGNTYTMQYFQRAVFEYHPEYAGSSSEVLLSLLGTFLYQQRYPTGAPGQHASTDTPRYFPATGKTLGGKFRQYWETHGGLAQQGYPISDEFQEVSALNGQTYTVQYFQRAVFELHPENQPPNDVLLSLLGKFRYDDKHGAVTTPSSTPTGAPPAGATPTPSSTPTTAPPASATPTPSSTPTVAPPVGSDPLPGPPVVEGTWATIRDGHELIPIGDRVLDWETASGHYRVWHYDATARGATDPLPGPPLVEGTWATIRGYHVLIPIGDRVLDWEPASGHYRIWNYDATAHGATDPLPGRPVVEGTWATIRQGHELIYIGGNILDWEPVSGHYRIWRYDVTARGATDPLPGHPLAEGTWATIGYGHQLIPIGDRVLDWGESLGNIASGTTTQPRAGQRIRCRGRRWSKGPGPPFAWATG